MERKVAVPVRILVPTDLARDRRGRAPQHAGNLTDSASPAQQLADYGPFLVVQMGVALHDPQSFHPSILAGSVVLRLPCESKKHNKAWVDNPLPVPSQIRRVATILNLKRRGAPGSGLPGLDVLPKNEDSLADDRPVPRGRM